MSSRKVENPKTMWDKPLGFNADSNVLPATGDQGLDAFVSHEFLFPLLTELKIEDGGRPPARRDMNALFKMLGEHSFFLQTGGTYQYRAETEYQQNAIVMYNGELFKALKQVKGQAPAENLADNEYWQRLIRVKSINNVTPDANGNIDLGGGVFATLPGDNKFTGNNSFSGSTEFGVLPSYSGEAVSAGDAEDNLLPTVGMVKELVLSGGGGSGGDGGGSLLPKNVAYTDKTNTFKESQILEKSLTLTNKAGVIKNTQFDPDAAENTRESMLLRLRDKNEKSAAGIDVFVGDQKNRSASLVVLNKSVQFGELGIKSADGVKAVTVAPIPDYRTAAETEIATVKTVKDVETSLQERIEEVAEGAAPGTDKSAGPVKLSDAVDSSLSASVGQTAATPLAVKTVNDKIVDGTAAVKGMVKLSDTPNSGLSASAGNTAFTPKGAEDLKNMLMPKNGNRGETAGYSTVRSESSSITVNKDSADVIYLGVSGSVTLTFSAASSNETAVKVVHIKANSSCTLTVNGATWSNKAEAPKWGTSGKTLILVAHFCNGVVTLGVFSNDE